MLTTVHLKGMVLLEVELPTAWKLDIMLETDQLLNQLCYDSILKVLSKELTLVLSDTRELDRVPNTK